MLSGNLILFLVFVAITGCPSWVCAMKRRRFPVGFHVLAYNLKRVMNIMGIRPLIQAMQA